jgi:hypothetical protein
VWITVWSPQYWKFIKKGFLRIIRLYPAIEEQRRLAVHRRGDFDGANDYPLEPAVNPSRANDPMRILISSHAAEDGFVHLVRNVLHDVGGRPITLPSDRQNSGSWVVRTRSRLRGFRQNFLNIGANLIVTALLLLFCGITFVSLAAAGTAVVYLELDNMALSSSPNCGVWMYTSNIEKTVPAQGKTEELIELYYRNCYESDPSLQDCNMFSEKNLHVQVTENEECPFNGDVCLLGNKSAIALDTGYLDSKHLGVNSPQRLFFRRRNICAPLVIDGYARVENISGLFTITEFQYVPNSTTTQIRPGRLKQIGSPGYEVLLESPTRSAESFEALGALADIDIGTGTSHSKSLQAAKGMCSLYSSVL